MPHHNDMSLSIMTTAGIHRADGQKGKGLLVDHGVRLSGQTMALQMALPPLVCVVHSNRTIDSASAGLMSMPGICNDVGRQPCWCMNLCDLADDLACAARLGGLHRLSVLGHTPMELCVTLQP